MPKETYNEAFIDETEPNLDLVKEKIALIREWLGTQNHLPKIKDDMLVVFLHSCYYHLERTKACIESYYTMRTNSPEIFTDRDATKPGLARALDVMRFAILPVTDPNGYRILYVSIKDPNPAHFTYVDVNKLLYMTIDAYLHHSGTEPGTVLLHSMKGATLRHLIKVSLTLVRKTMQYQQEGNPIRLKAIHLINVVPWIERGLELIRPFVKSELLNLIHFHTSGIESLYEYIPKECLPQDLGGDMPTIDALHAENTKTLTNMRDFFLEEEQSRVDESQREKKKKTKTNGKQEKHINIDELF